MSYVWQVFFNFVPLTATASGRAKLAYIPIFNIFIHIFPSISQITETFSARSEEIKAFSAELYVEI